jgi:hypothetical protein
LAELLRLTVDGWGGTTPDAVQHVPDSLVRPLLENPNAPLLSDGEQWFDVAQEALLVGLNVNVGFIEVADCPLDIFLVAVLALKSHLKLHQCFLPAAAEIKASLNEVFENRIRFIPNVWIYIDETLKLGDIKRKNRFFKSGWLWSLSRNAGCARREHEQHGDNGLHHY